MKLGLLAEPVLVGRDRELEQLQQHLNSAIEGKGATIFISGEAGAGKTRLLNEFLNLAQNGGIKVISGWCLSKAAVPYFPFVEALNAYLSSTSDEKAKSTVSEQLGIIGWLKGPKYTKKSKEPEILSPEIMKDITFAAVAKTLLSISAKEPTILFIEDIHWADSASLALLHYISRAIVSSKVLVLATIRREELHPDTEGHPHPLIETLRLMGREDLYREIKLSHLNEFDVAKLAKSMLGESVDVKLIDKLAKESEGNPLFAVESVRMLFESRSLVQEDGQWRLSVDERGIPTKVKDVILRRFDNLKLDQRRILDLASVIGEKFDPTLLGAILSIDKLHVLEALYAVAQSTLLIYSEDSFYRFGHAKFREVLYEEISSPLRREYHARVAETMENLSKAAAEIPVNDLAFHYAQAGNVENSVKYSLAAGEHALKKFSNTEAVKYFTYVLGTTTEDPKYKNERITALEGLGDARFAMGLFEKAIETFERLSGISDSGAMRLRALRKAMEAAFRRGNFTHTLELASKAEEDAAFDRLEYARIRVHKARTIGFRGNIKEALRDLEDCLRVFEEENSLPDVADALRELSGFYVTECRVDDALRVVQRSVALYEELRDSRGQVEAYFWGGNVYLHCGLHQEALDSYGKAIKICEKIGDYNRMAWVGLYSGLLFLSIGDYRNALSKSLKAIEYSEKTDSHYIQTAAYMNAMINYAQLGDLERAEEYYKKMTKLFAEASHDASRLLHAIVTGATAVFFAAKGQWSEANKHFDESLDLYKGAFYVLWEAVTRTDYAKALMKQGRTAEAITQIKEALCLYSKLGNKAQVTRLSVLLAEISK